MELGGVKASKARAVVKLHPGVGLALSWDESRHVAGGDVADMQDGEQHVGKVLAHARAQTQRLGCAGSLIGCAPTILHLVVDAPGGFQRALDWVGRQIAGEAEYGPVRLGQRRCEGTVGGAVRSVQPAAPDQCLAMGAQNELVVLTLDVSAGTGVAECVRCTWERRFGRTRQLPAPQLLCIVADRPEAYQEAVAADRGREAQRQCVVVVKAFHDNSVQSSSRMLWRDTR